MPMPPAGPDDPANPWPAWPRVLRTSSSHEEGCTRRWNLNTLRFIDEGGAVAGAEVQTVRWEKAEDGRMTMIPEDGTEVIKADIVFIAMGFLKPELPQSVPDNVFYAGDALNGASLVVRAMASGVSAAAKVDRLLRGETL